MIRAVRSIALSVAVAGLAACSIRDAACGRPANSSAEPTADQIAAAQTGTTAPQHFKILFLGDSLTAGLGLLSEEAYPVVIRQKFATEGYANVEVLNASVSGDTTAGGLQRLDGALETDVRILVLALGGNDALRGLPVTQTHDNLARIIEAARDRNIMVLLAGMEAPTNLGEDYQEGFHSAFVRICARLPHHRGLHAFLARGRGGPSRPESGRRHPSEQGGRRSSSPNTCTRSCG